MKASADLNVTVDTEVRIYHLNPVFRQLCMQNKVIVWCLKINS